MLRSGKSLRGALGLGSVDGMAGTLVPPVQPVKLNVVQLLES
jgi:hypothetical protein